MINMKPIHGVFHPKKWGDFNFEKLKSLGEVFFSSYGRMGVGEGVQVHMERAVIMATKGKEGEGCKIQVKIIITTIFFLGKVTFMITFKEKLVFIFKSLI